MLSFVENVRVSFMVLLRVGDVKRKRIIYRFLEFDIDCYC